MPSAITRRRFIHITGMVTAMSLIPTLRLRAETPLEPVRWQGVALGADASLTIYHPDRQAAARIIDSALAEVRRLESIFSLYSPDSVLSRLNATGQVDTPPEELVELLAACETFSRITGGAFDATVQPLWEVYAAHFSRADADPAGPGAEAIAAARRKVGHANVAVAPASIRFAQPGMRLTLNGVAQGYITDRVSELLRAEGIGHTLVDMGEIRALDGHPAGHPWTVAIRDPRQAGHTLTDVPLQDSAIATSSPLGTRLDASGRFNHIFDPATGACAARYLGVSVEAPTATTADALSTAFCLMPMAEARRALAAAGGRRAWFLAHDGTLSEIAA
jgi:thiamine biosynthesis lipoprotein